MKDTRSLLLDLGEALMRQRGYDGFSYADIAAGAGIRKASIHYHFPTKADLGLAVLERYVAELADALTKISSRTRTGGQAIEAAIQFYRDALGKADSMCLCSALAGNVEAISDEMRVKLAAANDTTTTWIEGVLLSGRRDRSIGVSGEPALEAKAVLAQLQGAQLLARAAQDIELFDQAISTLTARISRH
jgi:TetR/AcrR family transcriptional repressor of nem operon